jgi:hypothetical protein
MEAEESVDSHYQATASEDTANQEDLVFAAVVC